MVNNNNGIGHLVDALLAFDNWVIIIFVAAFGALGGIAHKATTPKQERESCWIYWVVGAVAALPPFIFFRYRAKDLSANSSAVALRPVTLTTSLIKVKSMNSRPHSDENDSPSKALDEGIVGFMFDTNIFNEILDRRIDVNSLPKQSKYYVTHIQKDEIMATKDTNKKNQLLKIFNSMPQDKMPTESGIWGGSKWGEAKWSDGKSLNAILKMIKELDKKDHKKKSDENQTRDALISETCIKNLLILVTNDGNLHDVTIEFKGRAIDFVQFLQEFQD